MSQRFFNFYFLCLGLQKENTGPLLGESRLHQGDGQGHQKEGQGHILLEEGHGHTVQGEKVIHQGGLHLQVEETIL